MPGALHFPIITSHPQPRELCLGIDGTAGGHWKSPFALPRPIAHGTGSRHVRCRGDVRGPLLALRGGGPPLQCEDGQQPFPPFQCAPLCAPARCGWQGSKARIVCKKKLLRISLPHFCMFKLAHFRIFFGITRRFLDDEESFLTDIFSS